MQVTAGDIDAMVDVVTAIAESCDDMLLEDAIAMRDQLNDIAAMIKTVASLCETRAKHLLDGQPAKVGNKIYVEKQTGKWRPNQAAIRRRVAGISACDANGELLEPMDAAARAVELMYQLFVSPSAMPKQAGLKELGLTNKDIAEWEHTGSELKVVETSAE